MVCVRFLSIKAYDKEAERKRWRERIDGESRFSIDNLFRKVSFDEFKDYADRLEKSLLRVRPTVCTELVLTTNQYDYNGPGSLTIITPESEAARDRRERYPSSDLSEKLWERSYKTSLRIFDNSSDDYFTVWLSNEAREPKRLFFYGQRLDAESKKVLDGFKKTRLFQRCDDGHSKISDYALAHALHNLGIGQEWNYRY